MSLLLFGLYLGVELISYKKSVTKAVKVVFIQKVELTCI